MKDALHFSDLTGISLALCAVLQMRGQQSLLLKAKHFVHIKLD
jgi:hypothetical protein